MKHKRKAIISLAIVAIIIVTITQSWAADVGGKVFTNSDLRKYTSKDDEKNREYNRAIIQKDRDRRERQAGSEAKKKIDKIGSGGRIERRVNGVEQARANAELGLSSKTVVIKKSD
jgi:hypothetical protein